MSEVRTDLGKSFDTFLQTTAEAAITHVVNAAKTVLESVTVYVVGTIPLEYNDEYHYLGDGMYPSGFFLDEEAAKQWCAEQAMKLFGSPPSVPRQYTRTSWWDQSIAAIQNDDAQEARMAYCKAAFPDKDEYDVTFGDMVTHAKVVGDDVMSLLPAIYTYSSVNAVK